MPKAFDMCRKSGGKIRSTNVGKDKYYHICILNGKFYRGEVKSKSKGVRVKNGDETVSPYGNTAGAIAKMKKKGE